MLQGRASLVLAFFFLSGLLGAKDWKDKPVSAWTSSDLRNILDRSPWVYQSDVSFPSLARRETRLSNGGFSTYGNVHRSSARFPTIRILSARPVRDALLMRHFNTTREQNVSIEIMAKEGAANSERARQGRLERYSKKHADDIRVAGDPDYIVFSITIKQVDQTGSGLVWLEHAYPVAELDGAVQQVLLTTKTGKRIPLSRYVPPTRDRLGGKLYFPRWLPDGRASVSPDDQELKLEFSLKGKKVTAKFNLDKMVYREKLEI